MEFHQLAGRLYRPIAGALNRWRLPHPSYRRQSKPLSDSLLEDAIDLAPDPFDLRHQIVREDAIRIRIVSQPYPGWLNATLPFAAFRLLASYGPRGDSQGQQRNSRRSQQR